MLSREDILKIASLSRLTLSEGEIEKFQKELSGILDFFKELEEVPTDGVEPTAQVTGMFDALRSDVPSSFAEGDLLSCSARPVRDHHVVVPAVL